MRQILSILFILFSFSVVSAQESILIIDGSKPTLFLNHKVLAKENFYSIGRLFNISPKEIAPFNKLDIGKGLSLGQTVRIPLTSNNFIQAPTPLLPNETLIPIYHIVEAKETLPKLVSNYGAPAASIRKWNNLKSDALVKGNKYVVGYLKVSKELSAFANKSLKKAPVEEVTIVEPKQEAVKVQEEKPAKSTTQPIAKEEPKVSAPVEVVKSTINFKGGFFKSLYDEQSKNKTEVNEDGVAGVFKTTSGWQDGKYYCFSNTAPQGSILKVYNSKTARTVYAKVLDLIPDIKQNTGLLIQLSNAAAEELGVADPKFDCKVTYFK